MLCKLIGKTMYLLRYILMRLFVVVVMPKVYSSVKLQDVIFSFSFLFLPSVFVCVWKIAKLWLLLILISELE